LIVAIFTQVSVCSVKEKCFRFYLFVCLFVPLPSHSFVFAMLNKAEKQLQYKRDGRIDGSALFSMVCVFRLPYCAGFVYVRVWSVIQASAMLCFSSLKKIWTHTKRGQNWLHITLCDLNFSECICSSTHR